MSILRIYHAVYQTRGSLRGNVLTTLEALSTRDNSSLESVSRNPLKSARTLDWVRAGVSSRLILVLIFVGVLPVVMILFLINFHLTSSMRAEGGPPSSGL
ncbi:unnamed protein product [Nesidiocoris tenuis]|uniref:Uncharacterized protein n=1 Tax=Nesidiocoris tenuis TaxID=355587 RepID=A0A6H5GZM7_9HEMI|nr:unnamed protein product [Nesidiocoris tenuis]